MPVDLHGGGNLVSDRTRSSSESVRLTGKDVELAVSCSHCLQKEGTFPRQLRVSPECCANMAWGKGALLSGAEQTWALLVVVWCYGLCWTHLVQTSHEWT